MTVYLEPFLLACWPSDCLLFCQSFKLYFLLSCRSACLKSFLPVCRPSDCLSFCQSFMLHFLLSCRSACLKSFLPYCRPSDCLSGIQGYAAVGYDPCMLPHLTVFKRTGWHVVFLAFWVAIFTACWLSRGHACHTASKTYSLHVFDMVSKNASLTDGRLSFSLS